MARTPSRPRWYFSLRSPYSWFAYRDLLERYPDVADAIEWIPCWEPDQRTQAMLAERRVELPLATIARAKNFYIIQDVRRLAEARGWTVSWPIDRAPVWEVAHLGYLLAEDADRGRDYIGAVYRARWERGEDISDPATIAAVAASLGLDADRVCTAWEDQQVRERGVQCLLRSHKDGLFGVPFFVRGHDKFFGVDRLRAYVAAVRGTELPDGAEQSWLDDSIVLPELATVGGDGGHAGGCG